MSKLEELIQEYCPNGVEYKKLGEVCQLITGATPSKAVFEYWDNGTISWMSSGEVNLKIVRSTEKKITQLGYDSASTKIVPVHSVIIALAGQGKTRGKVAINEIELCTNQSLCSMICNDSLNYKYLYYYLDGKYEELRTISNGDGSRGGLSLKILTPYKIPVPPLPVQREIVRILDNFTELTSELTSELTARKKQYEYYRDKLLSPSSIETEDVLLRDIATYSKDRISASEVDEDSYVGVDNLLQFKQGKTKSSHVPTEGNLVKYQPEDILIGNIRPYLKKIWFADNVGGTNGDVLVIRTQSDKVLAKYLYCNLSSDRFFDYDNNKSKGAKMPRGDKESILDFKIKIPPIDVQKKIVDTLNNFDSICSDLNIGLPAEIEARQKQYEYYRDALLTFAETGKIIDQTDRQTDRQTSNN